jgi:hypothetical protein
MADNGAFFIPWGRKGLIPEHMQTSMKTKTEGGTEVASGFFAWCEKEIRVYL